MPVRIYTSNRKLLKSPKLEKWLKSVIRSEKSCLGNIDIVAHKKSQIKRINKAYLNHDYVTDIITFDYSEKCLISGDLYVCIDKAKDNSVIYNEKQINEVYRVFVHGVLHLLKFDDKSEKQKRMMRNKENHYLKRIL